MGATLFVTCTPCLSCAKLIVQGGIRRIVFGIEYDSKSGAAEHLLESKVVVDNFRHIHPSVSLACIKMNMPY